MLLSHSGLDGSPQHPFAMLEFWEFSMLMSHTYTGPRLRDYQSQHIEFLWVWWFEVLKDRPLGW
jgi:hypothetical protein